MKNRVIDKLLVSGHRHPTDDVWRVYANHLITAFGDLLMQEGLDGKTANKMYCEQRVRELDNEIIESLVYTLPPAFIKNEKIKSSYYSDIHWGASSTSPFILLGHVGTGKSTFLDYTFLNKIPQKDKNIHVAIVNFIKSQDNHDDFIKFLCQNVNEAIENIYPELSDLSYEIFEKLFSKEFASYKSSFTDKDIQNKKINELIADYIDCHLPGKEECFKELIKRKIDYIKSQKKILWIILDNIDQHHSCLQNDALVSAISIATKFGCPLVISMRYISLTTPAAKSVYSSYRPRKLKLSFPDPSILVKKRLEYFKEISQEVLNLDLKWTGGMLKVEDLVLDVENTIGLLSDSSFMSNHLLPLSNYNMRRLLEIFLSVFQSYFFFFDRFNNNRYKANKLTLKKRFIYAHLLKNEDYYGVNRDDKEAFVLNLFENENKSYEYNHTIRIRLLQGLMSVGNTTTLSNLTNLLKSTFDYENYDLLQAYRSFIKSEIFAIKGDLNLSQSEEIFHEGFSEEHMFQQIQISITHAGRYHYDLLQTLEYIEIMKFSTYIPDATYLSIQGEKANEFLNGRASSTKKFISYISKEENFEYKNGVKDYDSYKKYFGKIASMIALATEDSIREIRSYK